MDFKERLIIELEELTIKIDRLGRYLEKQNVNDDFKLEEKQLEAMARYKDCLEQRILKLMNKEG